MLPTTCNSSQTTASRRVAVLLAAFLGATVVGCAAPSVVGNPLEALRPVGYTNLLVGGAIGGSHKHGAPGCGCNGEPGYFGYSETCWRAWPEGWVGCPIVVDEMTLDDYPHQETPSPPRELVPPTDTGAAANQVPRRIYHPEDPDRVLDGGSPRPATTTPRSEDLQPGEAVTADPELTVAPSVNRQLPNPLNSTGAVESPTIAPATEGRTGQPAPTPIISIVTEADAPPEPNTSPGDVDSRVNIRTNGNQTQALDPPTTPDRSQPAQGTPTPQPDLQETAPRQSQMISPSRTDLSVIKLPPSPAIPLSNTGSTPLPAFRFTPRVEYQSTPPRLISVDNDINLQMVEIDRNRKESSWSRIKYVQPFDAAAGGLDRGDQPTERVGTTNHIRLVRPFTLR